MKNEFLTAAILVTLITGLAAISFEMGRMEGVRSVKTPECQHMIDKTPELIWNDDFESFPGVGELVRIERDDEDVIYLGPAE
jgi:hypothetical protein